MPNMVKLITSATISSALLRQEFEAGLTEAGHPGYPVDYEEIKGSYDDKENSGGGASDLYDAFHRADNDLESDGATPQIYDLIVSAGGLVSAHAAQDQISNKPFLVIVGQLPRFTLYKNKKFFGGVNLDMSGQNILRHDFICGHYGFAADKVCLIWNDHSKMGKFEQNEWNLRGWPDRKVTKQTDQDIKDIIDKVSNDNQAAVISGDPFFAQHMDTLIKRANLKVVVTCYPFNGYAYNPTAPLTKKSMIYGPDLKFAYRLVGRKAGTFG
jgi:hypothetical protein